MKRKTTIEEARYKESLKDYNAGIIDSDTMENKMNEQIKDAKTFGEVITQSEKGTFLAKPDSIFHSLESCRCSNTFKNNPVLEKACKCGVDKQLSNKPEDQILNCTDYKELNKKDVKKAIKRKLGNKPYL